MKIFKTNEYYKFYISSTNRKLDRKIVEKLKKSILKNGYKKEKAIIVNRFLVIFHGQHRFTACKELGLPIYYSVMNSGTK